MTCTAMLDRMVEADLAELEGRSGTVLALHLRECARCRAIAEQLLRDTSDLAQLLSRAPKRISSRRSHTHSIALAMAGLAAALLIVAVARRDRPVSPANVGSIVMRPVEVSGPVVPRVASSTTPLIAKKSRPSNRIAHVRPPTGRPTQPSATLVERTVVAAVDRPVAVRPVRIDAVPQAALGDTVSVDPPSGKRARVLRTDVRGVTVVWLTSLETQP